MSNYTLLDINNYLEELFSPSEFKDHCPNGLQVEGKEQVSLIATAVSASLETIEAAAKRGVDLLIVHHGMFWNRDPYPITGTKRKKIETLLCNGISLIGYHLPLDAHRILGNNWGAAKEMGWKDIQSFGDLNGMAIGVKGTFAPCSREDFQKTLEQYYNHQAHVAFGGKKEVSSVALISGGAHWNITDVIGEGIDCFITGSFDEPVWHLAYEGEVNFYAMGHSATERVGPRLLAKHLSDRFSIPCGFIDLPNPF